MNAAERFYAREAMYGRAAPAPRPPAKVSADRARRAAELAEIEARGKTHERELVVPRAADGLFYAAGKVNGAEMRLLIDSGANLVVLSIEDAARAGIRPAPRDFTRVVDTVASVAKAAPIEIATMHLGAAVLTGVRAQVMRTTGGLSVFGMSGLNHFSGYGVRDGVLTLAW